MKLKSKKERREQFFALQGLEPKEFAPQGLNLTPRRAFSLAEAMIVLLIGTIALGMSAPMISRQLKNETSNNVQFQVLTQRVERATVPAGGYISKNNITASTYANSSNMTMLTGGGAGENTMSHENRPPYYALAYIMKTR